MKLLLSLCRSIAGMGLLILLLPMVAYGQCTEQAPCPELARLSIGVVGGGVPVAAGCSYVVKQDYTTHDGNRNISKDVDNDTVVDSGDLMHVAQRIILAADGGYTIRRAKFHMCKTGSPTFTIAVNICNNNSDDPYSNGTGDCTAADGTGETGAGAYPLDSSTLTTDCTNGDDYYFTWTTGKALANSGTYWLKVSANALGTSSNYIRWFYNDGTGTLRVEGDEDDSGTWTLVGGSIDATFSTYSCE